MGVKLIDPAVPKLRFRLSDGSVDLMKAFSFGGFEGIGGAWKMPTMDETFDARFGTGSSRAVRLASNSPPVHKPAGYFNRMCRGSELGRQVAVDFESDADFHECRSCPVHSLLPPFHIGQQPKLDDV
jgi:hypothetical protein